MQFFSRMTGNVKGYGLSEDDFIGLKVTHCDKDVGKVVKVKSDGSEFIRITIDIDDEYVSKLIEDKLLYTIGFDNEHLRIKKQRN